MTKNDPAGTPATQADQRPAETIDVINAMKAISLDMQRMIQVLHATINFLTILKRQEDEQVQDTL